MIIYKSQTAEIILFRSRLNGKEVKERWTEVAMLSIVRMVNNRAEGTINVWQFVPKIIIMIKNLLYSNRE